MGCLGIDGRFFATVIQNGTLQPPPAVRFSGLIPDFVSRALARDIKGD
jgi:hypothetical protein